MANEREPSALAFAVVLTVIATVVLGLAWALREFVAWLWPARPPMPMLVAAAFVVLILMLPRMLRK